MSRPAIAAAVRVGGSLAVNSTEVPHGTTHRPTAGRAMTRAEPRTACTIAAGARVAEVPTTAGGEARF